MLFQRVAKRRAQDVAAALASDPAGGVAAGEAQILVERWLGDDSTQRLHPGYRDNGRPPIETDMSVVSRAG